MQIAIIIVTYNRPKCLSRLLQSVNQLDLVRGDYEVIISIDGGGDERTVEIAKEFAQSSANKRVVQHPVNLGLKKHILTAGDFVYDFDAVVILEDDLFIAPGALNYLEQAISFVQGEHNIAGISLYRPPHNETAHRPFIPVFDGYDNFFLGVPASSGQAWTRAQWNSFRNWYNDNQDYDFNIPQVPENVKDWPESSWKKYFQAYLLDTGKTFFYPHAPFTTNFGDSGTHVGKDMARWQVELSQADNNQQFRFSNLRNSNSVYDAYCESQRCTIPSLATKMSQVVVDLYGTKPVIACNSGDTFITTKTLSGKPLQSFGRKLKPIELNVLHNISGDEIHLYKINANHLNESANQPFDFRVDSKEELDYWYGLSTTNLWPIIKIYQDHLRRSTNYRIGRLLMAPFRLTKRFFSR